MDLYERANNICGIIRNKVNYIPETAVILGSGLGAFSNSIESEYEVNFADLPNFPVSTVSGHAGKLIFGSVGGKKILAMQGRIHLYEGYSTDDVTLPIRVFQLLGVKNVIITNAAGAVNKGFKTCDLMIINDHISLFCPSPLTGINDERLGLRFPSMSEAYDKSLIEIANKVAKKINLQIKNGVYCYCKGPMYETPAEIKFLSNFGCDAVGMSTVPEVISAVHGNMRVLGISCITNMAAGILDAPLSHSEVLENGKKIEKTFSMFLSEIIKEI